MTIKNRPSIVVINPGIDKKYYCLLVTKLNVVDICYN